MRKLVSSLALTIVFGIVSRPDIVFGQQPPPVASSSDSTGPADLRSSSGRYGDDAAKTTTPDGPTISGNTLNGTVQIEGVFGGSTPAGLATPEPLPLNLNEAIRRGLAYNLGVIGGTKPNATRERPAARARSRSCCRM